MSTNARTEGADLQRLEHHRDVRVETEKSISGISSNLLFKAITFLAAPLFQLYYAHTLGARTMGDLGLAFSVTTLATTVCNLGLDTSLTRFGPPHRAGEFFDKHLADLMRFTLAVSTGLATVAAFGIVLFRNQLTHWISPQGDISVYFIVLGPYVVLGSVVLHIGGGLRAAERFKIYSFINDLLPRAGLGLGFIALHLAVGLWAPGYLIAYWFSGLVALLIGAKSLKDVFAEGRSGPSTLTASDRSKVLLFGLKTCGYTLVTTTTAQMTRVMLGAMGRNEEAGIVVVVEALALVPVLIRASAGTVFIPQASRLHAVGKTEALMTVFARVSRWAFILCLPYVLVLVLNPSHALSLYGPVFMTGSSALAILMVMQIAVVIMGQSANLLYMTGRENWVLVSQIVAAVATILLGMVLIPPYGLTGAAIAVAIPMFVMHLALVGAAARILGQGRFGFAMYTPLVRPIFLSAIVAVVLVFARRLTIGPVAVDLVIRVLGSYAFFLLLIWWFDWREEDALALSSIRAWLPPLFKR